MKKKILVVPRFYPSKEKSVGGFFKDQMLLMSDTFDFAVLNGKCVGVTYKDWIKSIIKNIFKHRSFVSYERTDDKYSQEVPTMSVEYIWKSTAYDLVSRKQYELRQRMFDKLFDQIAPDLIHIQSASSMGVYAMDWAKRHNIPTILTEHCNFGFGSDYWSNKVKALYEQVDRVLCVSHSLLRHLLMHLWKPKSFAIVGNYVNEAELFKGTERACNNKVLFVAAHKVCKDVEVMIDAVEIAIKIIPDIVVSFIGMSKDDGDYGSEYYQMIVDKGLQEHILMPGRMNRSELRATYSQHSMLISTSHGETFGLAVAEALMNGLPVACTDSGGIREFVDESNGIVVHIQEPRLMAEAIISVLSNLDKYDAKKISSKLLANYGKSVFKSRMIDQYNEVMR
ncbi:MAG: glycosyltransferase family 4 protein [Rikenellaceae bacterium]